MRKGKSLIGMRVISEADGADLGHVRDLVFDHDANHVLALLMSEKDLFGLIDAQVVPWEQITGIGRDAITAQSVRSRLKAGDVEGVQRVMHRNTALSGTRVYTTDGRDLGTLADTFLDDKTGQILGYELSGGFVSDTMTGKKFLPADFDLSLGRDVALVPPAAAQSLDAQSGGLQGATQNVGQGVSDAYISAKDKVAETYASIADASVEKQKSWVVGKTAGSDVILPAASTPAAGFVPSDISGSEISTSEIQVPGAPSSVDVSSSGEIVSGEVLVRKGDVITAAHADLAARAGVLHQLLGAVAVGPGSETVAVAQGHISNAVAAGSAQVEAATIGKPAAREVLAPDGSVIVAEGQIITLEIMERAKLYGKSSEVIAVGSLGAASQAAHGTAQNVGAAAQSTGDQIAESVGSLWDAAKQKVSELTHAAHEKKADMDAQALQSKINYALGRPVTRVILDKSDTVILNTGDLITNAGVERARNAGVLNALLDSVHDATPDITPEMMRAGGKGESALESQQEPSGTPITATVAPETPAQDTPAQGQIS